MDAPSASSGGLRLRARRMEAVSGAWLEGLSRPEAQLMLHSLPRAVIAWSLIFNIGVLLLDMLPPSLGAPRRVLLPTHHLFVATCCAAGAFSALLCAALRFCCGACRRRRLLRCCGQQTARSTEGWLAVATVALYAAVALMYSLRLPGDSPPEPLAVMVAHGSLGFRLAATGEFLLQLAAVWAADCIRYEDKPIPARKLWGYSGLAGVWCLTLCGPTDGTAGDVGDHALVLAGCSARVMLFLYCLAHVGQRCFCCHRVDDWRSLAGLSCRPGRQRLRYLIYHLMRRPWLLIAVHLPIGYPLMPLAPFACAMRGGFALLLLALLRPAQEEAVDVSASSLEREMRESFDLGLALKLGDFAISAYYGGEPPPQAIEVRGCHRSALNGLYDRSADDPFRHVYVQRLSSAGSVRAHLRATPHGEWELSSSPSLQAGVRWAHAKDSASSPDRVRGQWMEWHEASIGPNPNLRIVSADPVLPEPRFERHGACAQTDMHWALHEEEGSLATRSKLGLPPSPSEASSQESGDEVSIVLAFRGTASVQNVFSDLNFALRPLELGGRTFSPSPLSSPMAGSPRAGSEAEGEIPVQEYAALRGSHAGRVDQKFTPRKLFPSGSSSSAQGLRPLEPGFVRQISEQLREATTSALSPRGLGVTDSEPVLVHRGFSQAYMSVRSEVMLLLR
ncbi:unnamed protein product, partial [Polarella glacialis]